MQNDDTRSGRPMSSRDHRRDPVKALKGPASKVVIDALVKRLNQPVEAVEQLAFNCGISTLAKWLEGKEQGALPLPPQ